jgi:hypothetical protein
MMNGLPPMKGSKIVRANAAVYVFLVCMFGLVAAYQLRISLDTVHLERSYDFWVPFQLAPFTDRVDDRAYFASWEQGDSPHERFRIHWRDELLAVNGRPFLGMSMYLQELVKVYHQPLPVPPKFEWHRFFVTIRSSDSRIHNVEINFPHCTCGIPTIFQAAGLWIVPQMFCVVLGFLTVFFRPRSLLAWAFLSAMLSLSQLQFWSDWYTDFQQTATPVTWADWYRVPAVGYRSFVQHAWPAVLLVASAHFYRSRRNVYRLALGVAALFVVFAMLEAMLQIAWSEDFRRLVWLNEFLEHYRTGFMIASLAAIAGIACFVNGKLGSIVVAIGLLATFALFWSPTPINGGQWHTYSDDTRRFEATIPPLHNTPGFVALVFASGCVLTGLIVVRRQVTRLETISFIFCVPIVLDVAGSLGKYWYPLGLRPFLQPPWLEYWPWFILTSTGIGLVGITWSVLRRTISETASTVKSLPITPSPDCGCII